MVSLFYDNVKRLQVSEDGSCVGSHKPGGRERGRANRGQLSDRTRGRSKQVSSRRSRGRALTALHPELIVLVTSRFGMSQQSLFRVRDESLYRPNAIPEVEEQRPLSSRLNKLLDVVKVSFRERGYILATN